MGDPPAGVAWVERALRDARQAGDGELVGECSAGLAYLNFVTGQGVRADLVRLARASPAPPRRAATWSSAPTSPWATCCTGPAI